MPPRSPEDLARLATAGDTQALDALVGILTRDIYALSRRMLGAAAEAEDATQEILIKIITHLASFRGDSTLRTWTWTIATRHLMGMKRSAVECATEYSVLERMLDEGAAATPLALEAQHARELAEEVRLGCTQAMLTALDRDQRMAFILGDIFELSSEQAAQVLEVDAATYRKRLERARKRLGDFLTRKCGLVNPLAACRCLRQIPVLARRGMLDVNPDRPRDYTFAAPLSAQEARQDMDTLERVAQLYHNRPDAQAPANVAQEIRAILKGQGLRLLDA